MKMLQFNSLKNTQAYKEIVDRYGFKLTSFDSFQFYLNDLYDYFMYGNLNNLAGSFIYCPTLIRFAKKYKKSVFKYYKEQKEELQQDAFNEWLNKEKKLDITDLFCGEQEDKDEILRLLAADFLRGIAYILFDSYESENDALLKNIKKQFEKDEEAI